MPATPPTATYPSVLAVSSNGPTTPRFFTNDAIQAAVDRSFTKLPTDGHAARLIVQGGDGHIAAVFVSRLADSWTVHFAIDQRMGGTAGKGRDWQVGVTWDGSTD